MSDTHERLEDIKLSDISAGTENDIARVEVTSDMKSRHDAKIAPEKADYLRDYGIARTLSKSNTAVQCPLQLNICMSNLICSGVLNHVM